MTRPVGCPVTRGTLLWTSLRRSEWFWLGDRGGGAVAKAAPAGRALAGGGGHLGRRHCEGASHGESYAAGEHPDDAEQESPCSLRSEHGPADQRGQAYHEAGHGEPPR
jgi:hypothetical protein